jgi:hypothetical protein
MISFSPWYYEGIVVWTEEEMGMVKMMSVILIEVDLVGVDVGVGGGLSSWTLPDLVPDQLDGPTPASKG